MEGEVKKCPKCGASFQCNNANILNCACMEVPLDAVARQKMASKYKDCLCISCLKELVSEAK